MSSTWFRRIKQGITTSTREKKETPDGLWHKCPECKDTVTIAELKTNLYVCSKCNFHNRINSAEYFDILFDAGQYETLFDEITPKDRLEFVDVKPYEKRLKEAQAKTGLCDSMTVGYGLLNGSPIVIACMEFKFIGGSMGSVMGEKISRGIDFAIANKTPMMIISKSGGARMMESGFSLMQMAKVSAKLTLLANAGLPYISFLTDPTTGGVTASFAMLGDVNISEPKSLIGFAGPRVVKETIKKDLPVGFQQSEFVLEHGFLDFITERKNLKARVAELCRWFGTEAA
ncbi:MAG: acetyl-CoA carboxylase carboxyltransferase subunit beta [Bacteroidetes bacterium]|nr:acetyl-CoA carboxylase carboxyltransferase subunit beta [Bacteroidota bacterium]